jgi:hypothetical protein
MSRIFQFFLGFLSAILICTSSCRRNCEPSLIDLYASFKGTSSDIILNEPVAIEYSTISEYEEYFCEQPTVIPLSFSSFSVEYFENINDLSGDKFFSAIDTIAEDDINIATREQIIAFDKTGIYLITCTADVYNTVPESNEGNNTDTGSVNLRSSQPDKDIFENASNAFMESLQHTSGIIVIGGMLDFADKPVVYKRKPIYYAK